MEKKYMPQQNQGISSFEATTKRIKLLGLKSIFSKILSVLVLVCLFSYQITLAQNPTSSFSSSELSLPIAVEIALQSNPLTRATSAGQDIAAAQMLQARAMRMPLIQLNETLINSNSPVFVFGTLLEQGHFKMDNFALKSLNSPSPLTNFRSSISLKMPLFDQDQAKTRMNQAKLANSQASAQSNWVRQQIRFQVIQAYYGVLVAEAKKKVANEAVNMAEADVKRLQALYDNGLIVVSDLLAMKVQLSEFQQQQIQAQGDLVTAYAALNTVMGTPISTPNNIKDKLLEREFLLVSQEELTQLALKNRPDYQQSLMNVAVRSEDVRNANGQYKPRIDVFANLGNSGNYLFNGSPDYTVGVSVTFNLFDAGRQAKVKEFQAARVGADAERQHKEDQIRLEIVRAYQSYLAAKERLQLANAVIKQATEAKRIVQDRHEVGLTTITEVLRTQTALVRSQLNVLSIRYEYYVSYAQALLVSGQLDNIDYFIK